MSTYLTPESDVRFSIVSGVQDLPSIRRPAAMLRLQLRKLSDARNVLSVSLNSVVRTNWVANARQTKELQTGPNLTA
jgi:hypothetical protein